MKRISGMQGHVTCIPGTALTNALSDPCDKFTRSVINCYLLQILPRYFSASVFHSKYLRAKFRDLLLFSFNLIFTLDATRDHEYNPKYHSSENMLETTANNCMKSFHSHLLPC